MAILGWMRQEASMPQQPITGDAGSPRRPRTMDKPRRAAWAAAFKKLNAGLCCNFGQRRLVA